MSYLRNTAIGCLLGVLFLAQPAAAQSLLFQQPGRPGSLLDIQDLEEPRRAPLTITPSLAITGEYNDNIFIDNHHKVSDFIIGFTPGISLQAERPTYRVGAGYNFTSEIFTKETDESHAFDRQNFWLDALYHVDPNLTLTLTDTFVFSTDTNLVSSENVSTGRDRALGNELGAGVAWQFAPLWTLHGGGSWTVQRFEGDDLQNSDVYKANFSLDRRVTSRLTVDGGYEFGYFDIEREEKSTVHTPRVGVRWQATPTIDLLLRVGPAIEIKDHSSAHITPAITASYRQRFSFGGVGLSYDRQIGTAGGLGGTTDNQLISGVVEVTRVVRGLVVQFVPRYSIVESTTGNRVDLNSFTAALQATYRITPWMALIGGYQFFRQRSDSTALNSAGNTIANDADQNRLFFGVQFGYPIRFD